LGINWLYWGKNGTLTILDQFFFSGSNFLVNILLARWFAPEEYGAFTLVFAVFLFFSGFHTALLTEPMSVYGARYENNMYGYYVQLLKLHFLITAAMALLVMGGTAVAGYFVDNQEILKQINWMAAMMPLMLLVWFQRRFCYLKQSPIHALLISIVYSVTMVSGIYGLYKWLIPTVPAIFVLFGISSTLGAVAGMVHGKTEKQGITFSVNSVLIENWEYGKWMFATVFLQWMAGNLYFILMATLIDLESLAGFKALHNFIIPISQVLAALSLYFIPWLSRSLKEKSIDDFHVRVKLLSLVFFLLSILYVILAYSFSDQLFQLYSDKYRDLEYLLFYYLLISVFAAVGMGLQIGHKALLNSKIIFNVYLASSIFTISCGSLLVYLFGIVGAVVGTFLTVVIQIIMLIYFYYNQSFHSFK
jgi:O-antigen/teichoic acid export membrane protein